MPTNYLRRSTKRSPPHAHQPTPERPQAGSQSVRLDIAGRRIAVEFHPTPSAQRILAALPLFSIAETWGDCIHFEIPIRGGRDRTARLNAQVGELYYWAEEERLLLIYGPTPISGRDTIRLPRPCNLIGHTTDDLDDLRTVHPGQKVQLLHAQ
ncbi:MAG: hypothetical protein K0U74_09340 [Alphaproteobacteria bacterium]|nr:hypothetical protein [Alphaproteobacteria bacterium]